MDKNVDSDATTRQRLLESACDLFADKGLNRTTNREICDRAGANSAAVNYYFGTKENLYTETWRKSFNDSLEAHPPDGGVPSDAPLEKRLEGRIKALIHGNADKDNKSFRIAHMEMASPTDLLKEVMKECLEPLHEEMTKLVRELLGPHATEQQVRFCEISIVSPCMDVARWRHFHAEQEDEGAPPPPVALEYIDAYAEHLTQFSLAGIRAIRDVADKGGNDD